MRPLFYFGPSFTTPLLFSFFAEDAVDPFHVKFFGPVVIVDPVLLLLDVSQLSVTEATDMGHA